MMIIKYLKIFILMILFSYIGKIYAYNFDGFLQGSALVNASGNMNIEGGVKRLVLGWVYNLGGFLGLAAVFGIVYGSFMMVIASGEEEKIKKSKSIVIWSAVGFLAVVFAATIIRVIIEFLYSF